MGLRVLLADDHVVARSGISADIERSGFEVCAEAADADGAVEAAVRERPDVCLLDVNMPGSGIEAARQIVHRVPGTRVVMLSVSHEVSDVAEAIGAGAVGYVYKESDVEVLAQAIQSAASGRLAFPGRRDISTPERLGFSGIDTRKSP